MMTPAVGSFGSVKEMFDAIDEAKRQKPEKSKGTVTIPIEEYEKLQKKSVELFWKNTTNLEAKFLREICFKYLQWDTRAQGWVIDSRLIQLDPDGTHMSTFLNRWKEGHWKEETNA